MGVDDTSEGGLVSVCDCPDNNFIQDIAEANGAEILNGNRFLNFGDEGNHCRIPGFKGITLI